MKASGIKMKASGIKMEIHIHYFTGRLCGNADVERESKINGEREKESKRNGDGERELKKEKDRQRDRKKERSKTAVVHFSYHLNIHFLNIP